MDLQARMKHYFARQREIIEQHGWMVQGVFGTKNRPSFNYTIGMLDLFGFELLVFAIPMELAQHIFNDLGAELREGKRFEIGKPLDTSKWLQGNYPFRPVQCNTANPVLYNEYVRQAVNWHDKRGFPVVQFLVSDAAGLLPDEPGFDEEYMGVRQPRLDV